MERKLLSLPSFFVLLLIAGIAFLAVPVVDVQAQTVPTATIERVTMTPTGAAAGTALTAGGAKNLFIIKFNTPVNVASATATVKFDVADIKVTYTDSSPISTTVGDAEIVARLITLTPIATTAAAPLPAAPAANQWFAVSVAVPANGTGTITLLVRGSTATPTAGAFQAADNGVWATTADHPGGTDNVIHYNTYDGTAPVATLTGGARTATANNVTSVVGGNVFQIEIAFDEAFGTAEGAGFDPMTDLELITLPAVTPAPAAGTADTRSTVAAHWLKAGTGTTDTPEPTYVVAIDPYDDATSVEIKLVKDAVADANGNKSIETSIPVTINRPPEVTVKIDPTVTDPIPTSFTGDIKVTFTLSAVPSTGANDDLQPGDITVTNGTLKEGSLSQDLITPPTDDAQATYTAMVTLPAPADRETPLTIAVKADGVMAGGLGNVGGDSESDSIEVTVPTTPIGPTTPMEEVTGVGDRLSGNRSGFSFTVDLSTPNMTNTNRHLVLAKKPDNAGFTSGAGNFDLTDAGAPTDATRIDIKDDLWVDLRHFLVTREGGTIDLIGPTGDPVKSLVISEVMWGNDAGLGQGNESNSQWIELYNTTNAPIDGTWELVFTAASRGAEMVSGDALKVTTAKPLGGVTTAAAPVVDKLSTWRDVGNFWEWRISDSAGGSHGQSGKSTPNSATSVGSQQELVSMQRKINYTNVVKTHDTDDGVKNRTEQLKAVPGGVAADNWEATPEHGEMMTWRKGTPGARPRIKKVDQSGIARGSVVFNEIANRSDKKHDWIELYNNSSSAKKINGWELSVVSVVDGTRDDRELFIFTSDDDINVPAKGFLLIVNTDPRHTTLEGGYDVANPGNSARQSDGVGANKPSRLYYVSDKLDIPEKDFLLILRNGNDKTGTHEKVEDVAGNNPRFDDDDKGTQVWPLNAWSVGALDDLGQKNDKTWVRDQGKAVFHGDAWKPDGGFTGVGIARNAGTGNYTSGTPGYANNAVQTEVKSDGLTSANAVIISEIMFAIDGRSPQWIELYNPSHTQAVNLKGWELEIVNYYSDETLEVKRTADLKPLPEVRIQPNQTILIVSRATSRNSDSDAFPSNRIIDVWAETTLRNALDMQNQRDAILSARGFYLKLSDPRRTVVDEVGNIGTGRTDEPDWELPGGVLEDGGRSSMVRDVEGSAGDGTERDAWRDASIVDSSRIQPDATELYYGDEDDRGTPGYTPGGVLPVQLSSFYSKRNDAGAVVITWSTESELDNAGFNILRSQSRTGEFTRINAQLIPGAGTTGEKTAYTWTDTSAKPNVLYFYQIEDVSLEGAHRTLRTTRLRGHVGAAGKMATTWGDLKVRE